MSADPNIVRFEALQLIEEGEYASAFERLNWLVQVTDGTNDRETLAMVLLCLGDFRRAMEHLQVVHSQCS